MKKLSLAIILAAAGFSASTLAEIRFNGFASIVAGKSISDNTGATGFDNDISFKNESIFALQAATDLQENLSATAQIVARGANDFEADFEWAYLTYEISDHWQVSAGKMRIPLYKYSDFLDVGYAYRWVRPPQSVYNLPFSTYEGLSFLHNSQLGNWDSSLQLVYGGFDDEIYGVSPNDQAELNNIAGLNWTLSYNWFSARAAYFAAETSVELNNSSATGAAINTLEAGLRGAGFTQQADNVAIDEDDGTFMAVGFSIDYNNILFDTEYTVFEVENSVFAKQTQYYASFGYRIEDYLLHLTYEDTSDEHDSNRFDQVTTVPQLNQGLNQVLSSFESNRNIYTLGARYDFHPMAALKVDYSRFDDKKQNEDSGLVLVAVDLVF
ncbi:porin [Gayadomonas joobiniege]|uniref:porin n=1 Tax=Gayadomonas joobiniege TaxID=1234606 RepID=UPI0003827942|nr:porin [Gayadomonas joobiniege]